MHRDTYKKDNHSDFLNISDVKIDEVAQTKFNVEVSGFLCTSFTYSKAMRPE